MKGIKLVFVCIFFLSLTCNIWFIFIAKNDTLESKDSLVDLTEISKKYPYLSQRILEKSDPDLLINFTKLRQNLRDTIEKDYGSNFAMYFEYLPTGSSIGVNEKTEFYPGSLLKVPTVMAYLHKMERLKDTSDPEVRIEEKQKDKSFGDLWRSAPGTKIKISKIIELILIESDNTAINILRERVDNKDYDYIYNGLDLNLTVEGKTQPLITPKAYSSIMKSLFLSTLLSKDNSQHVLELLVKSKFADKLPALLPKSIPVAHKIGVFEDLEVPVYSDCGIVYASKRQYLLCMASRSTNSVAQKRMSEISKMVYEYVSGSRVNTE